MKLKILSLIVIICLLSTSYNVLASNLEEENINSLDYENSEIIFSEPIISESGNYLAVNLIEADSYIKQAGKPVLPIVVKQFTFPFKTKIDSIKVSFTDKTQININKKIQPGLEYLTLPSIQQTSNQKVELKEDKLTYSSSNLFPNVEYDYSINTGLVNNQLSVIVTVILYPIRYTPVENILTYAQSAKININYIESTEKLKEINEYDLVIIAPKIFKKPLQPLIDHKNSYDVKTILKTTESIYKLPSNGGYEGRDKAEKIKYFIKDAIEEWGVKYVLLVGGMIGQLRRWYVPARETNLDDLSRLDIPIMDERGFISDLYYADIYNGESEFDDWDSNGNDIIAEWTWKKEYNPITDEYDNVTDKKDIIDLHPDVYVGRLACRTLKELKIMVDKIITYETTAFDSSWFKNAILVAGDTFTTNHGDTSKILEGEETTNLTANYLSDIGFNIKKLWGSDPNFNGEIDVITEMDKGAGFIHYSGHGNPMDWVTYRPDTAEAIYGTSVFTMKSFSNKDMLPICIVGGCHNSQFNTTLFNLFGGFLKLLTSLTTGTFTPRCWGWNIVRQENGGAIASIGNTGLGYGTIGDYDHNGIPDCIEYLGGKLETEFIRQYAEEHKSTLGEAHSLAISNYTSLFITQERWNNDSQEAGTYIDVKTVQQWVLLGDPSLKIGGYPDIH